MGVKPMRSDKWVKDTVRVMLRNPHYAGYVAFQQKKFTQVLEGGKVVKKRLAQPVEEQIIAEGKHTGIISRDVWAAAQALGARHPRVDAKSDLKNPLAGLLFCKNCGRNMALHPYKHAENRYKCKSRPPCYKTVKARVLLDAVIVALEEAELPALELRVKNGDGEARKIQQRLLAKLERQMEEYRAQEEKQYDLLETSPTYTQEIFDRRNKKLREKMDECQAAIYKARSVLPDSVDYAERVMTLKAAIAILRDEAATPNEQNRILKTIIERIEYSSVPSDAENRKRLRGNEVSPFEISVTLRL
jgi:hypothetical protein